MTSDIDCVDSLPIGLAFHWYHVVLVLVLAWELIWEFFYLVPSGVRCWIRKWWGSGQISVVGVTDFISIKCSDAV